MKKQDNTRAPVRRKITTAEKTERNRAKDATATKAAAREKGMYWEDLENMHRNANGLFAACHAANLIIGNTNLHAAMDQDSLNRLVRMAGVLKRDTEHYRASLTAIHQRHAGKTGLVDVFTMVDVINIGNEYQNWIDSFNTVIIGNARDITALGESFIKKAA